MYVFGILSNTSRVLYISVGKQHYRYEGKYVFLILG